MVKLLVGMTHKALGEVVTEIMGLAMLDYDHNRASNPWAYDHMLSWIMTIAGGTSEIQKEIIADRVLGLPRAR
jgi:alkylation response protein AidB-like acyl-CoA dehydrogenase